MAPVSSAPALEERVQHGHPARLVAGSTIFIPVFLEGVPPCLDRRLSHCGQGSGEVNLTAIECSFEEIQIQPIVRKDLKLTWPRDSRPGPHWITVGFDEDLGKAATNAVAEMVDFLSTSRGLTRGESWLLDRGRRGLPGEPGGGCRRACTA